MKVNETQRFLCFDSGLHLTNQHIDQVANASVAIGAIETVIPRGSSLVYVNGFVSKSAPSGLIERLGPFVNGVYLQLRVFLLLIVVTLSVRFGLPPEWRTTQRGGRELMEALGNLTKRKKYYHWALRGVVDRVLIELERKHRLSRKDIALKPERVLDPEQSQRLRDAIWATSAEIQESEALEHAANVARLV